GDGLVETVGACGFEARFLELLDGVSLSLAQTFAAGVAALERVVGKKFDVGPPGIAVKMRGVDLLSGQSKGKGKEKSEKQDLFHRMTPRIDFELTENSRELRM